MKRCTLSLGVAAVLAALSSQASAISVNFSTAEAPGVTCCGLVDSTAYAAYGLTVDNAYWYEDSRDTFDLQGLSIFTPPTATITFAAVSPTVEVQYFVIGGYTGTYAAFDGHWAPLGSLVVDASTGDVLGTHGFSGGVKYLTFAGDAGFAQVSGVTFAVPEPETYALMLAGLGVVGALVRRRRG